MIRSGYHRRRARPSQVNCDAVQEAISALLDNEAAELDAKTISRHLVDAPAANNSSKPGRKLGRKQSTLSASCASGRWSHRRPP